MAAIHAAIRPARAAADMLLPIQSLRLADPAEVGVPLARVVAAV